MNFGFARSYLSFLVYNDFIQAQQQLNRWADEDVVSIVILDQLGIMSYFQTFNNIAPLSEATTNNLIHDQQSPIVNYVRQSSHSKCHYNKNRYTSITINSVFRHRSMLVATTAMYDKS